MRVIFFDFLIVSVLKKCYTKKKFVVLIVMMKKLVNLMKKPFFKYLSLLVLHQLCVNVLFVAMDCSRPFEDEFKKKMA